MLLIERANLQGAGGRFSCSVAARRQTAANFSSYFQMAALCRDAARAPCCAKWKPTPPPSCNWQPTWTTSPCNTTARTPANASLKRGNAPASSWIPAADTAAHRPRRRLRPRHRANKINSHKRERPLERAAVFQAGIFSTAILARRKFVAMKTSGQITALQYRKGNFMTTNWLKRFMLALIPVLCCCLPHTTDAQTPSIIIQPVGQSSAVGGTIQFTISATGGGPLAYQCRKNSTNLANGTFSGRATVSGATTTAMTLAGVTT